MRIKVRYFASIREWTKLKDEVLDVPDFCTAEQLRNFVVNKYEKLELKDNLIVAVDGAFVDNNHVLNPQEEVALFPPVSGG